jgi:hypothetical protein
MQTPTGLVNYTFLTPSVEIKKTIFMGVPTVAIRDRFSNAAAVNVTWSTNELQGDVGQRSGDHRGTSPRRGLLDNVVESPF